MEKHRVKNGTPHTKNGTPHKPPSDPSNDEYITVVKEVTFDSLVEFSPHELNSCRGWLPTVKGRGQREATVALYSTTVSVLYTILDFGAL